MTTSLRQTAIEQAGPDSLERVKSLYYAMQSFETKLGGGEGVEGLYGSLKRTGMQRVLDCMVAKCQMGKSSHLVDIGAGLGRPLLHALVSPGVAAASGVEVDSIKCTKADAFLGHVSSHLARHDTVHSALPIPAITCSAIEQVRSLDPATHAYSFWEGVPLEARLAFGRLFAASRTLKAVAVVQRAMRGRDPAKVMADLGFGRLRLVDSFPVSMSGSGRSFTAYVFGRVGASKDLGEAAPSTPAARDASRRMSLSASCDNSSPPEAVASVPGYAGELMPSGLCDVTEPLTPALKKEGDASEAATAFQRSRDPAAAYRLVPHPLSATPTAKLTPSGVHGVARRVPVMPPARPPTPVARGITGARTRSKASKAPAGEIPHVVLTIAAGGAGQPAVKQRVTQRVTRSSKQTSAAGSGVSKPVSPEKSQRLVTSRFRTRKATAATAKPLDRRSKEPSDEKSEANQVLPARGLAF